MSGRGGGKTEWPESALLCPVGCQSCKNLLEGFQGKPERMVEMVGSFSCGRMCGNSGSDSFSSKTAFGP